MPDLHSAKSASQPHSSQRLADLPRAFAYAATGLRYLVRSQRNARIHLVLTLLALALALALGMARVEWAVLALTIGLVWTAEAFNTAIEAVVDLASPDLHPFAKIAKDTAAGAVLAAAITAIVVAIFLFVPPLLGSL